MKIGDRIRDLRKAKKLTLDQLSEAAGISKSYLWELENKDPPRPSADKLLGVAEALGVTVDYLIGTPDHQDLATAEDTVFFREYQRMSPELREKIRQMAKIIGNK